MKVLIAEDDALSRTMLARILQRSGYEVVPAENGARALEELNREDPPRLVLLDWIMPEKDGTEVCREVRHRKSHAYTYLILVSSRESKREIVEGLEAGADDYLTKPFDSEELKARLRTGERILQLEDRLVEARESMRFQATHDLLTSLWNRGVIVELLGREIHRSRRENNCTVVMLCDIDHFKRVNDTYGHGAGDDVLQEVARRLQNSVRSYDMVGRYGGEEFLVILNKCNPASAKTRAESLRKAMANKPVPTRSGPLNVTMSVGVALTTDYANHDVEAMMQEADKALYEAKAAGRDCVRLALPSAPAKTADPVLGEITVQRS